MILLSVKLEKWSRSLKEAHRCCNFHGTCGLDLLSSLYLNDHQHYRSNTITSMVSSLFLWAIAAALILGLNRYNERKQKTECFFRGRNSTLQTVRD